MFPYSLPLHTKLWVFFQKSKFDHITPLIKRSHALRMKTTNLSQSCVSWPLLISAAASLHGLFPVMSGSICYGFSLQFWEMYCSLLQRGFCTTCLFSQKPECLTFIYSGYCQICFLCEAFLTPTSQTRNDHILPLHAFLEAYSFSFMTSSTISLIYLAV